MINLRNLV